MNKKQKKMLWRIVISTVMLAGLALVPVTGWLRLVLYLATYLIVGYDILVKAGKGIRNRQVFDENFLMAVATVGAIALALSLAQAGDTVVLAGKGHETYQEIGTRRRHLDEREEVAAYFAS